MLFNALYAKEPLDEKDIEAVIGAEGWEETKSYDWKDFQVLVQALYKVEGGKRFDDVTVAVHRCGCRYWCGC